MRTRRRAAGTSATLASFLAGGQARRARPRTAALSDVQRAVLDARARASTGEWASAPPASHVGLYAHCHLQVYGVFPAELERKGEWRAACAAASRVLATQLGGDGEELAELVRWTWLREQERRRGRAGARVGWRLQFSAALVTDYLVAARSAR